MLPLPSPEISQISGQIQNRNKEVFAVERVTSLCNYRRCRAGATDCCDDALTRLSHKDKRVKHETALDPIWIEGMAEHIQPSKSVVKNYTLPEVDWFEISPIRSNFLKIKILRRRFRPRPEIH